MPSMDLVEQLRLSQVLPHVRGSLLDIGCGYNNLVRQYGQGVGVDVCLWPGTDVLVDDSARLPFAPGTFDTITIIAALNHIPNREAALKETRRILKLGGRLIVTMISPLVGQVAHVIFRQDEEVRGGLEEGELKGMTDGHVLSLMQEAGYEIFFRRRFEWGLNRLYVARPHDAGLPDGAQLDEAVHHHSGL